MFSGGFVAEDDPALRCTQSIFNHESFGRSSGDGSRLEGAGVSTQQSHLHICSVLIPADEAENQTIPPQSPDCPDVAGIRSEAEYELNSPSVHPTSTPCAGGVPAFHCDPTTLAGFRAGSPFNSKKDWPEANLVIHFRSL